MSSPKPSLDDLKIERQPEPEGHSSSGLMIAALVIAVVAAVAFLLWWRTHAAAIEVTTALAREAVSGGSDRTVLNASGYVTARREATVSSKVTGKVVEVLIEEGMKVKQGQVLARLDDTNVKANLDVAQAQLDSAKATVEETRALLKQAELEFERTTELARQKISSQSELDTAEANADSLKARIETQKADITVAERQVAMWQQQMDDLIIRAPFDGVVTTKDAQPGEMISPVSAGGGYTRTGIGTVVDMDSLEIEIDVNESYIKRVEAEQPVEATLDAYPDWKIPCKVTAIIPTADRQKSTVKVRVGFDKLDSRILPEMSVKVAFRESGSEKSQSHEVLIPKDALREQDGNDVVFVIESGRAERRAVSVGLEQNGEVEIRSGLSNGEKVIVSAPTTLKDGVRVKETKS